jgi:hypothetical protein
MKGELTEIDNENICYYLTPLEESTVDRPEKPVDEITVLDPACGSGHMLFYAFDILYQMYLEEGEVPEKYVPREILKNNLHGIDIDSGAAQIAALSLYLKAKEKSPDVTIPQLNIASADAVLINGNRKQDIFDRAKSQLEEDILEQIWNSFSNIREFGSLARIEERIDEIIENHREVFKESGQAKFTPEGSLSSQSSFVSIEGEKETWEQVKARLLNDVADLASEALDRNDPIEEMFAGEVEKTVELIDLLVHKYDVVVSNPPYLSSGKMGDTLKQFLKHNFVGYRNIYTSFIERCVEMTIADGYATLVTPHDFMSLYSFRKFRKDLISNYQLVEGAHLAGFSFSMKDRPFTIPFLLRKMQPDTFAHSRFYRLTHEQDEYDSHPKTIDGLNRVTSALRSGQSHNDVYTFNQSIFNSIERTPMNIYYLGDEFLDLFGSHPALSEVAEVKKGLSTGNDDRFVRKAWEIPERTDGEYALLQKSGTQEPYRDIPVDFVNWGLQSEMEDAAGGRVQNADYYFIQGVTFRGFGDLFTARKHTDEMIFDQKAHFVYTDRIPDTQLLAAMNSTVSRYIMRAINPGVDFNVGDGKRLPIKRTFDNSELIDKLVDTALSCQDGRYRIRDWSATFDPTKFPDNIEESIYDLQFAEELDHAVLLLVMGLLDDIIFDEYDISEQIKKRSYENIPTNLAKYHSIEYEDLQEGMDAYEKLVFQPESINSESELAGSTLRELSEETQESPVDIASSRYEYNQYSDKTKLEIVGKITSFCLGALFNRWQALSAYPSVNDEISQFSRKHSEGIGARLQECVDELGCSPTPIRSELDQATGGNWIQWVRNSFFEDYHCSVYKRRGQRIPIYWQLESPEGAFSCFIYYHGVDSNTLAKLRGQYLDPRIDALENELETLNTQTDGDDPDKELLQRKEEVQNDLDDIREFRDTIDKMIDDGVSVDVEKGIWENIKEWDQYEVLETGLPKLKSSYSR